MIDCSKSPNEGRAERRGNDRGSIGPAALLFVLLAIVVAGGVVDLYRLQEAKAWAYRTAEAAALVGATQGRDLSTVYTIGQPRVDPVVGGTAAEVALAEAMVIRGATVYDYDVVVWEWGGEVASFPPVSQADLWQETIWFVEEPSVGVYIQMPVETFLLGLMFGADVEYVHAAAVAAVSVP
jgi:Flp pilus assembly protein protease CpaA